MSTQSFTSARLNEIPLLDDGRVPMRIVRHHLGIQAFGINAFVANEAGKPAINEHDEADAGEEELYVVLSGHAVFTVDGEEVDAPTGTLLFVEPAARRAAVATEPDTTILAVGATPGKPYRVSGWEVWSPANRHFEAGEYEEAIELARPVVELYPEYPALVYNLACAESLAGRTDDALEHLARAIELDDSLKELAGRDSDLDPIRSDPRFAELVGSS